MHRVFRTVKHVSCFAATFQKETFFSILVLISICVPLCPSSSSSPLQVAMDPKSGLVGDSDAYSASTAAMWLVNKTNALQPLILADVAKYIAANPHLFDGAADESSSSSSSSSSSVPGVGLGAGAGAGVGVSASSTHDAESARAFSSAAAPHYAARLAALEPMLLREYEADAPSATGDGTATGTGTGTGTGTATGTDSSSLPDEEALTIAQRARNAANGWVFHSRQRDVDIYSKTEGAVTYCKGVGRIRASQVWGSL
jgi:hypothetical protein